MSIELMDEHEQGERVRAWLRENGASIVTGIALGIAAIAGWQWWQSHRMQRALEASTQFAALSQALESSDRDLVERLAGVLVKDHADSPFAALAALAWASQQVEGGELQGAAATLEQARALKLEPELAQRIDTRLARIHTANGQAEKALALLEGSKQASALEARGDALLALGRAQEAAEAYREAHKALDATLTQRRVLELKLADLGIVDNDGEQG